MEKEFKTQISSETYFKEYDKPDRFLSYFYQIKEVLKLNQKKVLEIGIGNKTVTNYLKDQRLKVTTCDFDKDLKPDYVADVRNLPFKENSFDIILICEVLEHIPYKDFTKALKNIHKTTKKYVVMSIPYSLIYFEIAIKFPFIRRIFNKSLLNFIIRIPSFTKIKFEGQHYWEIGRRGYPIKRIRKDISKFFKIKRELRVPLNPFHYFFILEKK